MAISDFGLTGSGYTAPREADFLAAIRDRLDTELTALGYTELPDYERDTFLGSVTEIMAYMLGQLGEQAQAVYDARSVANATGLQLGNLALLVGVTRDPATKGTVTLTCTGDDGTPITQGKIVQGGGDDGEARWVITEDAIIGAVTSGEVSVVAQAEDAGPVVATAGQVTTIVTPVSGWDAVTNASAADAGTARETDAELRARRQRALQSAGGASTNAILSALLELDFVTGAVVVDNKTGTATTIDGIAVGAFAVACVVAPNSLTTAQQEDVVAAIYSKVGAGTAMSGDQTGTVTKRDGRSETIRYYVASDATINLAWVLTLDPGVEVADVEDALLEAVTDYFLTLAVGDTVYPTPLIALAAAIDGIANVDSLLLNGSATAATHDADELPVLGTNTVT